MGDGNEGHTNNWAVLVCTSTFWFNYRHVANVLSVYHIVKRLGIADDHIILMLADDMACNARNVFPAQIFCLDDHALNVYDEDVEVDYRGSEVTVDNLLRLLTNRLPAHTPRSKRLASDDRSNILLYLTGHGGDNFLKFQDTEEIGAHDLADALHQMHACRRYREVLLLIDTCQASTVYEHVRAPGVTAIASSVRGESSYSYRIDDSMGVSVLDRFTWSLLEFAKHMDTASALTIDDLFRALDPAFLSSHPHLAQTSGCRPPQQMRALDFIGSVRAVDADVPPVRLDRRGAAAVIEAIEAVPSAPRRFVVDAAAAAAERVFFPQPPRVHFALGGAAPRTTLPAVLGVLLLVMLFLGTLRAGK